MRASVLWTGCLIASLLTLGQAHGEGLGLELHVDRVPAESMLVLKSPETGEEMTLAFSEWHARKSPTKYEGWSLSCLAPGLWCPVVEVRDGYSLPVFPAMKLTGSLAGPAQPPREGQLQGLLGASPDGAPLQLAVPFEIRDGRFEVEVPRRPLDLRFAFPGAAPVYRWDLQPPPPGGDTGDLPLVRLGQIRLQPGGSLMGWVQRWEDRIPVDDAKVTARPVTGNQDGSSHPFQVTETITGEQGFFQITGLESGFWQLQVTAPGRATRLIQEVEVQPAAETQVGVALLSPPLEIAAQVDPPTHPDGAPWHLQIDAVEPVPGEARRTVELSAEGRGEIAGLRPTRYSVKIQDASGSNYLVASPRAAVAESWFFEVPLVNISGTVRLGGEPLSAEVRLQGGAGDRVELESDESGTLTGWMRRPQREWLMATVSWVEGEELRQRRLEVLPSVDEDRLELEVDLPAGALHGEVVDRKGRPRSGVRVTATPTYRASRFTEITTHTERGGRFHFTGLDNGPYRVQAGGNGRPASEAAEVDLSGPLPPDGLRLVLHPTRVVDLRVTHGGNPVPGASVSLNVPGPEPASVQVTTDVRGRREVNLPDSADRAVVTVLIPGRPSWSGCIRLSGPEVEIALPTEPAGALTVTWRGRGDQPPLVGGRAMVLTEYGGFFDHGALLAQRDTLIARAEEDGELVSTLRATSLAAGRYAIAWVEVPTALLAAQTCAGGVGLPDWTTVSPGGEGRLTLDTTELQKRRLERLRKGKP